VKQYKSQEGKKNSMDQKIKRSEMVKVYSRTYMKSSNNMAINNIVDAYKVNQFSKQFQ